MAHPVKFQEGRAPRPAVVCYDLDFQSKPSAARLFTITLMWAEFCFSHCRPGWLFGRSSGRGAANHTYLGPVCSWLDAYLQALTLLSSFCVVSIPKGLHRPLNLRQPGPPQLSNTGPASDSSPCSIQPHRGGCRNYSASKPLHLLLSRKTEYIYVISTPSCLGLDGPYSDGKSFGESVPPVSAWP